MFAERGGGLKGSYVRFWICCIPFRNSYGIKILSLKSVVIYQQLWLFSPLCQILWHYVSYSYSTKLAYGEKPAVFCQDNFNTHGLDCTLTNIKILFLKIMNNLLEHWFGRHERHIMTSNFAYKQKRSLLFMYS